MAKKPLTGRRSMFRGKKGGKRLTLLMTKTGGRFFNARRKELAQFHHAVTGRHFKHPSDADVVEFMARGLWNTETYLREHQDV